MKKFAIFRSQAGDTIVEVLMAIVIISTVITGAYQITNRGLREEQSAIERTQASNLTSEQAEAIRSIRDLKSSSTSAAALWTQIMGYATNVAPNYSSCTTGNNPTTGSSPLYINTGVTPLTVNGGTKTSGQVKYWIEAYRSSPSNNYVDFHLRGCWLGIGDEGRQNIGIVLRLNTN